MPTSSDLDVLVVGGGPTGLVAAAELARRGVRVRIIDKAPERSSRSRALVVQARTLELFQRMGIADELIARGRRARGIELYVERRPAASFTIDDIGVVDTPYPFLLFVSQAETERLLDAHLGRLGLAVERPLELIGLRPGPADVRAELRRGDGTTETVRARYVVGADGAHSLVRKAAGLEFPGAPYPQDFILADVRCDWPLPDRFGLFLSDRGLLASFPLSGPVIRLIASRPDVKRQADPTLPEFQALVDALCPFPVVLEEALWLQRFHLHHRGVERYRAGRVFVAGDAAHVHSPAGGQGMNTGIQDAYNLAWKLALVIQGRAPERLLDSYHEERYPVGQRLLSTTDRMFTIMSSPSPAVLALRNRVLPRLAPFLLGGRRRRAFAFRFVSQLGIHYRGSAVGEESAGRGRTRFHGGPRPGDRAPDGPLEQLPGGRTSSLYEHLCGPSFALLAFVRAGDLPTLHEAFQEQLARYSDLIEPLYIVRELPPALPAARILRDAGGELHRRYGLEGPGLYLLRPDGHVAFRSPGEDAAGLIDYLERTLRTRH